MQHTLNQRNIGNKIGHNYFVKTFFYIKLNIFQTLQTRNTIQQFVNY